MRSGALRFFQRGLSSKVSKVWPSSVAAVAGIPNGATICSSGFGVTGVPENLFKALVSGPHRPRDLDVVSNDAGMAEYGIGLLLVSKQVSRLRASFVGDNKKVNELLMGGDLELEMVPQGTLAEKLRSGAAGIPAIYLPTGVGTVVEHGGFATKYDADGRILSRTHPKETRIFNGKTYLLEDTITTDFALIKGYKADTFGNVVFHSTARNFNPDCAKAGRVCIVEVEEIVEPGELDPDEIHLPGIYVHRVVKGEHYEKRIEKLTTRPRPGQQQQQQQQHDLRVGGSRSPQYHVIAKRAAKEFKDGMFINLGIGTPTLASNYIPENVHVHLQSENGLLRMGPYPYEGEQHHDLVNASKETVSYLPGSSIFSSSDSFAMIRGGKIDVTILGTLEVSQTGDVSNWVVPGKMIRGMGGAMDLVTACQRVVIVTTHCSKSGKPKILKTNTLPLTGKGVANLIITELAVFEVLPRQGGLVLIEHADGVSVEEIRAKTDADFIVADNLCVMQQ